jgi:hypothetical protein
MEPNTPKDPQGPQQPQDSREHKGLAQRLKEMLTGGNPDNTPEMQAKLEAARAENNAAQAQRAAERADYMRDKADSGAVPVVTAEEVQTGQTPVVEVAEKPQPPEASQQ